MDNDWLSKSQLIQYEPGKDHQRTDNNQELLSAAGGVF
jgi:hypothetical protein